MEACSVMGSILKRGGGRSPNLCCAAVCGSGWLPMLFSASILVPPSPLSPRTTWWHVGAAEQYSNAILCVTPAYCLSVFRQSDLEGSLGLSHIHFITVTTGDLIHNCFLPLLCNRCFQLDQWLFPFFPSFHPTCHRTAQHLAWRHLVTAFRHCFSHLTFSLCTVDKGPRSWNGL